LEEITTSGKDKMSKLRRPKGRTTLMILATLVGRMPRYQNTKYRGYWTVHEIGQKTELADQTVKKYLELMMKVSDWIKDFEIIKVGRTFKVRPKLGKIGAVPKDVEEFIEKHKN